MFFSRSSTAAGFKGGVSSTAAGEGGGSSALSVVSVGDADDDDESQRGLLDVRDNTFCPFEYERLLILRIEFVASIMIQIIRWTGL